MALTPLSPLKRFQRDPKLAENLLKKYNTKPKPLKKNNPYRKMRG